LLQDPLSGVSNIKVAGSTLTLNGLNGTIGQSPFTGWASVEFASKPMVKAELDFQRLALGLVPAKHRMPSVPDLDSAAPELVQIGTSRGAIERSESTH
jgi:AsmA protein